MYIYVYIYRERERVRKTDVSYLHVEGCFLPRVSFENFRYV